ncbi:MAG: SprT family zinc-dependent metalloprotease [Minisyncoccia bacterium]
MKNFIFGTFIYEYQLIKQDRKTLSLTVTPNLKIILKCPLDADDKKIEAFLKRKWFWLEKQLSFFKKYQRNIYEKEYISGEGFLYLGRQYKLVVKHGKEDFVLFTKGKLIVSTTKLVSNGNYNKKLINAWFLEKTEKIFQERFLAMLSKFDYKNTPDLKIREMRKRWGSFLNKDKILLNPKLISMPKECIDYVIVHELCHLKYKNHDKRFFELFNKKFPKWERVKDRLEILGASI